MSETILDALVKLFALIGDIHDETVVTSREKDVVRSFLARQLNNELVAKYMKMFEEYLAIYNSESIKKGSTEDRKRISLNAMRILAICEKINEELRQKQKIYVLVQLLDFISLGEEISENELDFLQTVSSAFNIPDKEFNNIKSFIMGSVDDIAEKGRILIADRRKRTGQSEIRHLLNENLHGTLQFLNVSSTNSYILRYSGGQDLYLNGQIIFPGRTYIFDHGSSIRGSGIKTVYYSEVVSQITEAAYSIKINLVANDVSYNFRNSDNGIHNLNFHEDSGKLVGIMGGSGVGKSTTLSLLNGTVKPQKGEVLINGYNLYDDNEKKKLEGIIGFVPQDDLLLEELTVFQNIWFNAKMCLNNLPEDKLAEVVNKTLIDFDLDEVRDLKVGNPLKKIISGGQRKRVNIALELLREPTILFVDEPTSGLSSVDSEMVMNLLKDLTYKGKLVIVNIHQPSSDIFKMFDRIMIIDKGGYQVFYGNPTEAIVYFKSLTNHANPEEDQCVKCGNVDTEQILQIIEAKVIDEHGKPTRIRKVTPEEWAAKFREKSARTTRHIANEKTILPENNFSIPGLIKQSEIFFTRDFLSKLADKQYILISLLGPPLLALLLAFFTKYGAGDIYRFSDNDNFPAYLFMCVITSLFFGLMLSSEEILKDRKILKRESFLNLSWFSYLNSKILIMFIFSAIQTISFVLIGNAMLEIKGMTLSYWLVLFTTSCFANILGLNISSAFNSVVTIYILIPFIIIPQLLFSGVMVKFDKLHLAKNASHEYVPVIGDLMAARWSFEALAVKQFRDNDYEKNFFPANAISSQSSYYSDYLIAGKLNYDLQACLNNKDNSEFRGEVARRLKRLNYHIEQLSGLVQTNPIHLPPVLNMENLNSETAKQVQLYLDSLKRRFIASKNDAFLQANIVGDSLIKRNGKNHIVNLKENYENKRLRSLVLDEESFGRKIFETPDRFIQKYNPGYMKSTNWFGRAHFYAPYKMLGTHEIDTYWFNIAVIWIVSILLYIALYYRILQRVISYFGSMRLIKSYKI